MTGIRFSEDWPVGVLFQCRLQRQENKPHSVHQWTACGLRPSQASHRSNLCIHLTESVQALDLSGTCSAICIPHLMRDLLLLKPQSACHWHKDCDLCMDKQQHLVTI